MVLLTVSCLPSNRNQSALFDVSSLLTVLLLFICSCTYIRSLRPSIFTTMTPEGPSSKHEGLLGICYKASRVGERLSLYVGAACAIMAFHTLFIR